MNKHNYDLACCFKSASFIGLPKVLWELTNRCNLHCGFCHSCPEGENDLQTKEVFQGIDSLCRLGVKSISFGGGEPFLRKDINSIIEYTYGKGIEVNISTNGTLLNPERCEQLKHAVKSVAISIDSSSPEIHNKMRGVNNAWESAINSSRQLIDRSIALHWNSFVCPETYTEIPAIVLLASRVGVKRIVFLGWMKTSHSDRQYYLSKSQREEVASMIFAIREKYPDMRIVTKKLINQTINHCYAGDSFWSIDFQGRLMPCIIIRKSIPNIKINELDKFTDWEEIKNYFNKIQKIDYWELC